MTRCNRIHISLSYREKKREREREKEKDGERKRGKVYRSDIISDTMESI